MPIFDNFFANVKTIFFHSSLAYKFYVDTSNVTKNKFGNTMSRKRALTPINVVSHDSISQ